MFYTKCSKQKLFNLLVIQNRNEHLLERNNKKYTINALCNGE